MSKLPLEYSLRREWVDDFFHREVPGIAPGAKVLDLGGHKNRKRGFFDIRKYDLNVTCLNLSARLGADVLADAAHLPFSGQNFDVVICSELLEHVPDPTIVVAEAHRVLAAGGMLLLTVPFLFRIHADPSDYGRYTDYYWQQNLEKVGFKSIDIEKQGLFWTVLVEMGRGYYAERRGRVPQSRWKAARIESFINWARASAKKKDARPTATENAYLKSFTTGFGIRAIKG